nr:reverse transcriptase domain-containing protein [Tanacetum cinerariifolium]
MAAEGNGDLPVPDLRTMEELCQPSLNGQGGPIAPISIPTTNFGLKNDMIHQVQNSCQFHSLPGDDANKHLDKLLHVTQSIKVNEVIDDTLCLYLFHHSLTHHATACDFLLEEVDAFLALEDDPTLPEVDQSYVNTEGDILLLEAFLNDDPSLPLQIKEIICLKFAKN